MATIPRNVTVTQRYPISPNPKPVTVQDCPKFFSAGFTLIEVLVVILIVTIMTGAITFTYNPHKRELNQEARRFAALVQLAADEAVLKGVNIGLYLHQEGYQFLRFREGTWQPYEVTGPFKNRALPTDLFLELSIEEVDFPLKKTEDNPESPQKVTPQIIFLLSGDYAAFQVTFKRPQSPEILVVVDPFKGVMVEEKTAK